MKVAETLTLLLAVALALAWLSRIARVPYPVALVLGGVALAFIPGIPTVRLDPQLVLMLFVAPLLYVDAFFAPISELRRNARSVALLASVLVGVTAGVVAVAAHLALGLGWGPAFALGGALAATDAVAPVQVLGRVGADPRLVAVVQGESLLNDGVAFTLLKVASSAVVTGSFSLLSASGQFLLNVLVGVAVGIAVGIAIVAVRRRTEDSIVEAGLSLITPFVAYIAADRLGASGILAAVAAGLWMGRRAHDIVLPLTRVEIQAAWRIIAFLLNSLLFLLVGLQVKQIVRSVDLSVGKIAVATAAILAALLAIRLVWAMILPSMWQGARGLVGLRRPVSPKGWRFALAWSGVRGSVALAAALSLPVTTHAGSPFPGRNVVILMALIVIVATLVLQGLTLQPVLRALGLTREDEAYREEALARERAAQAALATLQGAAQRHDLPEESRRWLEREYSFRSARFGAQAENGGDRELEERSRKIAETDAELLESARSAIHELEASGEVRADIAHKVLRDLDLDSARVDEAADGGESA